MLELPVLSISVLLPLASALYIAFFISQSQTANKQLYAMYVATLSSILTLISTIYILVMFDTSNPDYQFVEQYSWINAIGLEFYVGIDGISIYFVFLTALLTLICIISSVFTIKKQIKEYLLCFLLLESFCIGAFSSLNLLLFYLFFEVILIPMYLIIGVWGGDNRIYAAFKFFLYTFFGSVFFLLALIYIYVNAHTFSIPALVNIVPGFSDSTQKILWIATFIAFAVKVPMPPFHTWLPDAHVQAPTAGSVMLAGILLKLGAYAFLRISLPMLPIASAEFSIYVVIISVFAIIYASFTALAQADMKKMIAYSSVAHMGYVTAGIFTFTEAGINGAIFQMISHGIVSAALFLIVGILYERNHTKMIDQYGGVAHKMPLLAVLFMVSMLGSLGLPGTSGFIGEFFSLVGILKINITAAIFAATGVIFGAVYMLKLYKEVMLGTVGQKIVDFKDLRWYETLALLPLIICIIYFGIIPGGIMEALRLPVHSLTQIYTGY